MRSSRFGVVKITGKANEDGLLAAALQLPKGTTIKTIRHDYGTDSFEFLVYGNWLDEVPEGERAPEVLASMNYLTGKITYSQPYPRP